MSPPSVVTDHGRARAKSSMRVAIYTRAEVAKHNKENDCWVIISGNVCDITQWIPTAPCGRTTLLSYAGKDATKEWLTLHARDQIMKSAPWSIIGVLDDTDETTNIMAMFNAKNTIKVQENQAKAVYTLEDVAKHNSKENGCWVSVQGDVLDVTDFLTEHPGGELVLLNLAGKEATEEFLSIHPPNVYRAHAPYLIIGRLAEHQQPGKGDKKTDALLDKPAEPEPGNYFGALYYAFKSIILQLLGTLFSASNLQFKNDRVGLTRSAVFLMFFMVIHGVGNLHIFAGPDDFNGYGYFYARLYWTMGGLMEANAVEVYLALAICLHVTVALKRTWDINRNYTVGSGKLNLAITGVFLLLFMSIHLVQFRFGETEKYLVRPPPWYTGGINLPGILKLELFWSKDPSIEPVAVRDIYKMEFDLFQNLGWCIYYSFSAIVFGTHACLGWQKLVPAPSMAIPKYQQQKVTYYGWALMLFVMACYLSFPLYCYTQPMKHGSLGPQNEKSLAPVTNQLLYTTTYGEEIGTKVHEAGAPLDSEEAADVKREGTVYKPKTAPEADSNTDASSPPEKKELSVKEEMQLAAAPTVLATPAATTAAADTVAKTVEVVDKNSRLEEEPKSDQQRAATTAVEGKAEVVPEELKQDM